MMKKALLAASIATVSWSGLVVADAMTEAKEVVAKYASKVEVWDGPTSGPAAQADKTIVVLAGDLKNGGILGVTSGIEEAAKEIGWNVRVLDGAGSISGRTSAFGQALALKPDGIVINGFDAVEQKPGMEAAAAAGIPMVAWQPHRRLGRLMKSVFSRMSLQIRWKYRDRLPCGLLPMQVENLMSLSLLTRLTRLRSTRQTA